MYRYNEDKFSVEPIRYGFFLSKKEVKSSMVREIEIKNLHDFIYFVKLINCFEFNFGHLAPLKKVKLDWDKDLEYDQYKYFILFLLKCKVKNIEAICNQKIIFTWNEEKMTLIFNSHTLNVEEKNWFVNCVFNALLDTKMGQNGGKIDAIKKIKNFISGLKYLDCVLEERYLSLLRFGENMTKLSIRIGSAKLTSQFKYHEKMKHLTHFRYTYPIESEIKENINLLIKVNGNTLTTLILCLSPNDDILSSIISHCKILKDLSIKIVNPNEELFIYFSLKIPNIKSLEQLIFLSTNEIPFNQVDVIKSKLPNIKIEILPDKEE